MAHDSYHCTIHPQGSRPFPTQRKGMEHVGQVHLTSINKDVVLEECPIPCRPLKHKDWTYC